MQSYKIIIRWGIIIASLAIVSLILWNTYVFSQKIKQQERVKVEILATAYKGLNNPDLDADVNLEIQILESNSNIPLILTDGEGNITGHRNLDEKKINKEGYLEKQFALMKAQNQPLLIQSGKNKQYIYYRDSQLLTKLKN